MLNIDDISSGLKEFFKSRPVIKAWIFGSYARGEQNDDSDLDILVEFDKQNYPSLLTHSGIICDLEDLFNIKIDLVPEELLFESIRPYISKDKILVYERR